MRVVFFLLVFLSHVSSSYSQQDTTKTLSEVVVRAYELDRMLVQVAAPVTHVSASALSRFNNTSILPALNSTPGVKMEERSPGSFRLNIRGSSLRSPFGVRNVKIYFNGIPYTDPGGNSYLNQLGYYNIRSVEIIRGPGSSLYGAGTGGVLMIESEPDIFRPALKIEHTAGSYGLQNTNVSLSTGNYNIHHSINYQHHTANGYRDHTKMRRDVAAWHGTYRIGSVKLRSHVLLGDLFYETPGALTLSEYSQNRKAARPAVGFNPGATEARAAIYQKMAWGGLSVEQKFGNWNNTSSVYGVYSQLKNPALRNYGYATEPHAGGRTLFQLRSSKVKWLNGFEFQKSFTNFRAYVNNQGKAGDPISSDKINNTQYSIFTQLELNLKDWIVTAGSSINQLHVRIRRYFPGTPVVFERKFSNEIAPRLAILKQIKNVSLYASIARGFSPPTIAEVLPSTNVINTTLDAESGYNFEMGSKGTLVDRKLFYDINVFYFKLRNTIVQRRDQNGSDFFINAGSTLQKGMENYFSYRVRSNITAHLSYTFHHFRYDKFIQVNNDFSGNEVPSVSPHVIVAGIDAELNKIRFNLSYSYYDRIPLNDANTEYAKAYNIVDARINYFLKEKKILLFAGINNALDDEYSLGNDINGFGGRYYNAATGRNYFGGISLQFER